MPLPRRAAPHPTPQPAPGRRRVWLVAQAARSLGPSPADSTPNFSSPTYPKIRQISRPPAGNTPKGFPAGGREYPKKAATMARGYMSGLGSTS